MIGGFGFPTPQLIAGLLHMSPHKISSPSIISISMGAFPFSSGYCISNSISISFFASAGLPSIS